MAEKQKISGKIEDYAANPAHRGGLFPEDAAAAGAALVETKEGDLKIYWLVAPDTGEVLKARFFTYGGAESIACGEALSVMAERRPFDEAASLTGSAVVKAIGVPPEEGAGLSGRIEKLLRKTREAYSSARALAEARGNGENKESAAAPGEKSGWTALSKAEKLARIEAALDGSIRSFLRADGGDVSVVDLVDDREIVIEYHGVCGSCASSMGMTLMSIEHALREELGENIRVVPAGFGGV